MSLKKEFFKMLNVIPYEEFYLYGQTFKTLFRITEDLKIEYKINKDTWIPSGISLRNLIIGEYANGAPLFIEKILQPLTEKEKLAVEYAKSCGYKYLAKEKDGTVLMFNDMPVRTERCWLKSAYVDKMNILELPISFIKWEDEPYYIGD